MDSKSDLTSSLAFGGSISGTFKLNEKVVISAVVVAGAALVYVAAKKLIGGGRRIPGIGAGGMVQGGVQLGGHHDHGTGVGGMVQGEIELVGLGHANDGEIDLEAQAELGGAAVEG